MAEGEGARRSDKPNQRGDIEAFGVREGASELCHVGAVPTMAVIVNDAT